MLAYGLVFNHVLYWGFLSFLATSTSTWTDLRPDAPFLIHDDFVDWDLLRPLRLALS